MYQIKFLNLRTVHMFSMQILFVFMFFTIFFGCASKKLAPPIVPDLNFKEIPDIPSQPEVELLEINEFINTDTVEDIYSLSDRSIEKNSVIGVMDFYSPENSSTGSLVADIFSTTLLNKGFKIVDRQNIKKIIDENKMRASGVQKLSEREIINLVGQVSSADYIIFGSLSEYYFDNYNSPVPYIVNNKNINRYLNELQEYKKLSSHFLEDRKKMMSVYYDYVVDSMIYQTCSGVVIDYTGVSKSISHNEEAYKNPVYNIDFVNSEPIIPTIGLNSKEIEKNMIILKNHMDRCLSRTKALFEESTDKIKELDNNMTLFQKIFNYKKSSYYKYINYKNENEYIQNLKELYNNIVINIRQYHRLKYQYNRHKLLSIPYSHNQIKKPKPEIKLISVVNFGINFKIVDIKTGDIINIGIASKRDVDIQEGLYKMLESIVNKIVNNKDRHLTTNLIKPKKTVLAKGDHKAQQYQEIKKMILQWANFWSTMNTDDYLKLYSKKFKLPKQISRKSWESDRRRKLNKNHIKVAVSNLTIQIKSESLASVEFDQYYESDNFNEKCRKVMNLVKENNKWHISKESCIK
ncbi:Curli production assembly/transport component CsgG [Candidatus Magnetomorum sp. HK-1]|nr:Curli production assembly/transport component CsgG [Candidatus Magnetomorum sp. HK-1]